MRWRIEICPNRTGVGVLLGMMSFIVAAFAALAAEPPERADLQPNGEDWQEFPVDINSVHILADGRALFVSDRFVPWAEAKTQVESLATLDQPWTQGVDLLSVDKSGRLWLTDLDTPNQLRAWSAADTSWIEHDGGEGCRFRGPVFESSAGRVYVPDLKGVHVFEENAWSYQALHELNFRNERFYSREKSFNPATIVQDGAGRVYLHSRWGRFGWTGTMGYWVHNPSKKEDQTKAAWQQIRNHGKNSLERLLGIMPLGTSGSQFLVCPESADAFWVDLFPPVPDAAFLAQIKQLGARKYNEREQASAYLELNGRLYHSYMIKAHAESEDPEVRTRLVTVLESCGIKQIDGYSLRHVTPLHQVAGQGGWWFHADKTRSADEEPEENSGGIFYISGKGELTKVSKPVGYPDAVCLGPDGDLFIGTRLGVLLRCSVSAPVDAADAKISAQEINLPPHWRARELFGVDKTGRIFLKGRRGLAALRIPPAGPLPENLNKD